MIKFFMAEWCKPCQNFKASLEEGDLDGIEIVDIDANPDLVEKYFVRTVPTMLKVDEEGNEIDRKTGTMSRYSFVEWKYV